MYVIVCILVTSFVSFVLLQPSQTMLPGLQYVVRYVGPLKHLRGCKAIAYCEGSRIHRFQQVPRRGEVAVQFHRFAFRDPERMLAVFCTTTPLPIAAVDRFKLNENDFRNSLAHNWHIFPREHFRVLDGWI